MEWYAAIKVSVLKSSIKNGEILRCLLSPDWQALDHQYRSQMSHRADLLLFGVQRQFGYPPLTFVGVRCSLKSRDYVVKVLAP